MRIIYSISKKPKKMILGKKYGLLTIKKLKFLIWHYQSIKKILILIQNHWS